MKLSRREFIKIAGWSVVAGVASATGCGSPTPSQAKGKDHVIKLFNGQNLNGWYTFLLSKGRDNDPEGIFKVEDGMIHILGEEFGYLCTNDQYDNFHLTVEFKWGEKKFPPREYSKRDSGILYRFPMEQEDKVWPHSIECQIQESDCGDFWLVDGTSIVVNGIVQTTYSQKIMDTENPTGEWNTIEVIADGGKCTHLVNGVLVNEGTEASVMKGKILLQSEGAEIFYRKVELRPLAPLKLE
jgi:hypothetical protein